MVRHQKLMQESQGATEFTNGSSSSLEAVADLATDKEKSTTY
jgi:hypothetical protein